MTDDTDSGGLSQIMDEVISMEELSRIREWLSAVAGLCESPDANAEALVELIGKGARGILDRIKDQSHG